MSLSNSEYRKRIQTLQWVMLIINVVVIAIGGSVFALAVLSRPVLRITSSSFFSLMESICNMMVATGMVQMIVAAFDIFAACWKLMIPLYLGVGVAGISIMLQMAAIITVLYVQSHVDDIATEDVIRPWFVWECQQHGESCHRRLTFYVNFFMMPQVILASVSIVLHCLSIMYLIKLIRSIRARRLLILKAKEMSQQDSQTSIALDAVGSIDAAFDAALIKHDNNNIMENLHSSDEDNGNEHGDARYPATPASILKYDHGYVPAPGTPYDTDYDDVGVLRNRTKPQGPQSLTFSTNVEIHLFNPQNRDSMEVTTSKM